MSERGGARRQSSICTHPSTRCRPTAVRWLFARSVRGRDTVTALPLVVREDRGGRVAGLVLNRPDKLNAINREMIAELVAAVDACVRGPDVGVIVIRREGP